MPNFIDIPIILAAFILGLGFTVQARKLLAARMILDKPNERSSHAAPVPRGGGWALLAVLVSGMLLALYFEPEGYKPLWIIGATCVLAFISWRDDKKGVSAGVRLAVHILAALIGSFVFGTQEIFGGYLPFWLDRAVMVISWAWFMNLYNFMDGIDGITGVETIALSAGSCLLLSAAFIDAPFAHILALLLAGSCLGFLALNWYPAKIFMGDVGSVPLGFLTGFLLITIAANGHLIAALILPLYYLADSGITIMRRALRREKIWQAHREHFYQKAAQKTGRHDRVVLWIALADIALISAALDALSQPWTGFGAAIVFTALLLVKMTFFLTP